jgi:hydrogenase nickel incorporation protein HypA/HybF
MHEMALSLGLLDVIADASAKNAVSRVKRVIVEIGTLSHVEPEAMAFCFDQAAMGTVAEGAVLEIETPKGFAWCFDCEDTVEIGRRGDACPLCGGYGLMVNGGEELRLKELEVI